MPVLPKAVSTYPLRIGPLLFDDLTVADEPVVSTMSFGILVVLMDLTWVLLANELL